MSDATKDAAKAYGVVDDAHPYASRWTFIIGKDGKILEVLKGVNPTSHGEDLTARLAALGVPKRSPKK